MRHAKPVRLQTAPTVLRWVGTVSNCAYPGRLQTEPTVLHWVGTVSNCAYPGRLQTEPTGGESVYLFLEFTIRIGETEDGVDVYCSHR